MNKLFLENLDSALEEVNMSHVHCDNIEQHVSKINDLRDQVKDAEIELREAIDKMCADISIEIRQLNPSLKVMIKTNYLDVIYRSRLLSCKVLPYENCWSFDSTDFGRRFTKRYPQCCRLNYPINELAGCICDFFRSHFRSLI